MRYLSRHPWVILLALVYTLCNVPKPLTVDDGAYYYVARQVAQEPLRPYGFELFWYHRPHPANQVLAPPVLPYWWSLGLTWFGERPWAWKLWLFPFSLLFVGALTALARRFARGVEPQLVCLVVLSPLFLPSLNLMLDVPALALGLGAVALFCRACSRRSWAHAAVAGLLAGLAMQTKYTAFLTPAAMLLYAVLVRRVALGLIAGALAGAVFLGWEYFVFVQHGQSHFRANMPDYPDRAAWLAEKLMIGKYLLPIVGGVAPGLVLLGLAALGGRAWLVGGVGAVLALGYLVVACCDVHPILVRNSFWIERPLEQGMFGITGLLWFGVVAAAGWRLLVAPFLDGGDPESLEGELEKDGGADNGDAIGAGPLVQKQVGGVKSWCPPVAWRLSAFLLLWLLGEVAGYFALSPFPAARRVMGVFVVAALLLGRLAARTDLPGAGRGVLTGVVLANAALGLLFYGVDLLDACVQRNGPEGAAQYIRAHSAEDVPGKVWYVGHWGFQFYAEHAGMVPVVPDISELAPGDWLVVPNARWNQQRIHIDPAAAGAEGRVVIPNTVPLRTVQCFYGGFVPLEHHSGPRIEVTIYRVRARWVPQTPGPGQ